MIEVTVSGVTFSSLGLGVKKHDIPVLPPTKDYNVEISGRDGEIDFGSVYGSRLINIECVLMADDATTDYQAKVAALAAFFNAQKGDQEYRFSDIAGKRYMARYAGTLPIQKIIFDGDVTIPIKMHDPFPIAADSITELTVTATPTSIPITSNGTLSSSSVITLTNTGGLTVHGFTVTNEIFLD